MRASEALQHDLSDHPDEHRIEALAQFKTMQRVDVCIPSVDGRELVQLRHTQAEQPMLLGAGAPPGGDFPHPAAA